MEEQAPYLMRMLLGKPPEDWPMKGTRQKPVGEMRREYVRKGLITFCAEYEREKAEREYGQERLFDIAA
jgi:hypothetical protein